MLSECTPCGRGQNISRPLLGKSEKYLLSVHIIPKIIEYFSWGVIYKPTVLGQSLQFCTSPGWGTDRSTVPHFWGKEAKDQKSKSFVPGQAARLWEWASLDYCEDTNLGSSKLLHPDGWGQCWFFFCHMNFFGSNADIKLTERVDLISRYWAISFFRLSERPQFVKHMWK